MIRDSGRRVRPTIYRRSQRITYGSLSYSTVTTSAAYGILAELDDSDETEPHFIISAASTVIAAGRPKSTPRSATAMDVGTDTTVIAMLVDSSYPNIDVENLRSVGFWRSLGYQIPVMGVGDVLAIQFHVEETGVDNSLSELAFIVKDELLGHRGN